MTDDILTLANAILYCFERNLHQQIAQFCKYPDDVERNLEILRNADNLNDSSVSFVMRELKSACNHVASVGGPQNLNDKLNEFYQLEETILAAKIRGKVDKLAKYIQKHQYEKVFESELREQAEKERRRDEDRWEEAERKTHENLEKELRKREEERVLKQQEEQKKPQNYSIKLFPVLHLEKLLKVLQEKMMRAKDFYHKHVDFFTFKQISRDKILDLADKAEILLQNNVDFAHQSNQSEIEHKDSTGVPIDFDELSTVVHKTLDEFLALPIASIIETEGNHLHDEVIEEMQAARNQTSAPSWYPHQVPTNLQDLRASIKQTTNELHGLAEEASAILDVGRKLNRLRELEKLQIIEYLIGYEETNRNNEERLLQTLDDETSACRTPCGPCPKKESCIVQKMLPVYHFISFQDGVMGIYLPRVTGKDIVDNDERLGASFDELLVETGGNRENLKYILGRLMEHGMIRQLANGRYTQVGI